MPTILDWLTIQNDYEHFKNLSNTDCIKFHRMQERITDELDIWLQLWTNHKNGLMVLEPNSLEIVVEQYVRLRINVDQLKMLDPSNQTQETQAGPTEDEPIFNIEDLCDSLDID